MSDIRQEDIAEILNKINDALEGTGYVATGFDNTGTYLQILIDKEYVTQEDVNDTDIR